MSAQAQTYDRKCDECRTNYEHVKGAPTGFCPRCADHFAHLGRVSPISEPGEYHLPYLTPVEHSRSGVEHRFLG